MTPQDAARVLSAAAVYDNRTPSEAQARVWAADLGDITVAEAVAAVRTHYTGRPDTYLRAGHLVEIVRKHRRAALTHSWRAERDALAAVDPDDAPAVAEAIRRVRAGLVARPGSELPALPPGRYVDNDDQAARNARGKAAALAAIRTPMPADEPTEPASPSDRIRQAALERAVGDQAARRHRNDPTPATALFGAVAREVGINPTVQKGQM